MGGHLGQTVDVHDRGISVETRLSLGARAVCGKEREIHMLELLGSDALNKSDFIL